jgi:glycosyltransferase involved in cell wall biosynthesis
MKVLVFPNRIGGNPYFRSFLYGLNTAGIEDVRLASVLRLRSDFDAIHLHHPEHAVTQAGWLKSTVLAASLLSVAVYARLMGRPVVWMVHDVEPAWVRHKALLAAFMKAMNKLTTAYIFLNKSSQQFFSRKNPEETLKPFCYAPHSRFETTIATASAVKAHRAAHGIGETDILVSFLGSITPHKGLECAARLPEKTKSGRTVKLAVCGMVDHVLPRNYVDTVLRRKPDQDYIRLPHRLTDEALALWIQSSDAVFLPYRSGSNSGMALNVLSNHGRIIASQLPMFQELAERCGPSWVRCVDVGSTVAIEEIVESLEIWTIQERDFDRLEVILTEGDPAENGRKLKDFYHRLQRQQIPTPV